jgi:TetR/AcrR family transcriptional repressor of bet genes
MKSPQMAEEPPPVSKPNVVKEARQRQLIDATISTIGRVGYAGTTLNHVAGAAGLSPGIVNFYFKSKDQLLAATLAQLAEEHESLWMSAIAAAGGAPAAGLDAMIEADFHPTICTLDKVVVWFAFWAEAQSRPLYRSVVSELEERYFQTVRAMCEQLVQEGGYSGIDPAAAAHGMNALSDGLWADLLIDPENFDPEAAKRICRMFLAALFPRHFSRDGQPPELTGEPRPANDTGAAAADDHPLRAHRERLAAALQRRLFPATARQPIELAAAVGIDLPTLLDWLGGRGEPSSWQLGRLIAVLDPSFVVELYGGELAEMQARFETRLGELREEAERGRAAIDILRGADK